MLGVDVIINLTIIVIHNTRRSNTIIPVSLLFMFVCTINTSQNTNVSCTDVAGHDGQPILTCCALEHLKRSVNVMYDAGCSDVTRVWIMMNRVAIITIIVVTMLDLCSNIYRAYICMLYHLFPLICSWLRTSIVLSLVVML